MTMFFKRLLTCLTDNRSYPHRNRSVSVSLATLIILCQISFLCTACQANNSAQSKGEKIIVGAERFDQYMNYLQGKKIGIVVNHASLVGSIGDEKHLLDALLTRGIAVQKIFTPEHGFRGKADAGEKVESNVDEKTGLPIISLYGSHRKPTKQDLKGLDLVVFDIQDVGARFYTYISTMHYVMEACAEHNIPVIVLDRPNPNGFYVDGPVLDTAFKSFIGMHPVPIVHGMTVGEFAQMINGEGWLGKGLTCELTVISCADYDHNTFYELPTRPSPNLPNMTAIYLYPSLCLFEGTVISVGRGTDKPFQIIGHPDLKKANYIFTPESMEGAKQPKLQGELCYGLDLSSKGKSHFGSKRSLDLSWLLTFYTRYPDKENFFTPFFEKLAGTDKLRKQIEEGQSETEIRKSWKTELEIFKATRKKYLLYPDFY